MSIKEIAQKTGVSPATVSRILNNPYHKCLDESVKERVWECAIQMNYIPNTAARNLRLGRGIEQTNNYCISISMSRMDETQSDPFFRELLHIVESEIHKNACILDKVWYRPSFSDARQCLKIDIGQTISSMYRSSSKPSDGILIVGKCNQKVLKEINKQYKNVVSVNRNSTNYEVDEVICDGEKIASLAMEYLIRLGHRDIGYVGECQNEARYKGYLETLIKHNIPLNESYVFETKQTELEGYKVMESMISSNQYPSGIYCANDITAIGMLKCLKKYKRRRFTPSIVASDDIEEAQNITPMLTTVRLPKDEMGRLAISLLLNRIRGEHTSVLRMEFEGKLIVRNSCEPFIMTKR